MRRLVVGYSAAFCKSLLKRALELNAQQKRLCQLTYLSVKRSVDKATTAQALPRGAGSTAATMRTTASRETPARLTIACQTEPCEEADMDADVDMAPAASPSSDNPASRVLTEAELAEFHALQQYAPLVREEHPFQLSNERSSQTWGAFMQVCAPAGDGSRPREQAGRRPERCCSCHVRRVQEHNLPRSDYSGLTRPSCRPCCW